MIAEDDGLGLAGVEEVDAAQVGSQRAQAAKRGYTTFTESQIFVASLPANSKKYSIFAVGILKR